MLVDVGGKKPPASGATNTSGKQKTIGREAVMHGIAGERLRNLRGTPAYGSSRKYAAAGGDDIKRSSRRPGRGGGLRGLEPSANSGCAKSAGIVAGVHHQVRRIGRHQAQQR